MHIVFTERIKAAYCLEKNTHICQCLFKRLFPSASRFYLFARLSVPSMEAEQRFLSVYFPIFLAYRFPWLQFELVTAAAEASMHCAVDIRTAYTIYVAAFLAVGPRPSVRRSNRRTTFKLAETKLLLCS